MDWKHNKGDRYVQFGFDGNTGRASDNAGLSS
jgi:hypothetical protein